MAQTFLDAAWNVFALSDNNVLGSPFHPTNVQKANRKEVTLD